MKKIAILTAAVALVVASAFTTNTGGYKVGDKASDFKLKNVDSKMVSMSGYKDAKGIILVFTCNHCPYVQAYEQRLINLQDEFKNRKVSFVAINSNDEVNYPEDNFEGMVKRAKEKSYNRKSR